MAMTYANLLTAVKTRVRPDMATPAINNYQDASIGTIANEKTSVVIHSIFDPDRLHDLRELDVTLSSGADKTDVATFIKPSDYEKVLAVRVSQDSAPSTYIDCDIVQASEFSKFAQNRILTEPDMDFPVAAIADEVYVKPIEATAGKIDYIKSHPDVSSSGTLFDSYGDNLLIYLILEEMFAFWGQKDNRYLAISQKWGSMFKESLALEQKNIVSQLEVN